MPTMGGHAATPLRLAVDLFNYEGGGLQPDGRHDLHNLVTALLPGRAPDLILINEAKFWSRRGCTPLYQATNMLATALGRPYVGLLGDGAMPAALLYDPRRLALESWNEADFADKRQLAKFTVRKTRRRLVIIVDHWSPVDSTARTGRALQLAPYGDLDDLTLLAGDLNCTADGPLLPQRDWSQVPEHQRQYKGRQAPDGSWGPDTRPLDVLIGPWDDHSGRRSTGRSWYSLPDLAYETGTPAEQAYQATVNDGLNPGGALLNDWLLINRAWRRAGGLVRGSYRVHIPPGRTRAQYPSDHRRISADLPLPG